MPMINLSDQISHLICYFQIVFEKIFSANPIKPLFIMRDNTIHEWQFRWTLDRYVSNRIYIHAGNSCKFRVCSYVNSPVGTRWLLCNVTRELPVSQIQIHNTNTNRFYNVYFSSVCNNHLIVSSVSDFSTMDS